MTLDADEARAALAEADLDRSAAGGLGMRVGSVLLAGLGYLPAYLALVAAQHGISRPLVGVLVALAVAVLGAAFMASRPLQRHHSSTSASYAASAGLGAVVLVALVGMALWRPPSWQAAGVHLAVEAVVPLACALALAAGAARRPRR